MDNLLFKAGNAGQVNIDQAQGIVECFVAGIGNKDSVGDVVISGAFAKSLMRRKPRVVWGHSWNDPIGKVLEMYEVPVGDSRLPAKMRNAGIGGLYAKVQFNLNSEKGKEAFATVAFFGEEQEWSIGYKTIDSVFDPNLQANILKEVELYEVSPVLHGANQLTGTISIKGDDTGHMPVIPMPGMGIPMMNQVPRIVVVAAPQADDSSEGDPFAEGMSQELSEPDKNSLQAELAERTGSKIEIMNATENSVVFRRTTSDGQTSMYRLPYHREGSQYMFGKPEPYVAETPKPQPMQGIEQKPGTPVVVPNGGIAYRSDDQQEMLGIFGYGTQSQYGKSEISHLIELPEAYMPSAREFIAPVLRHHKLVGTPNAKGIVINGTLTANALDALQNAVKALGATLGQTAGNIGQAIGKIRDLAQTFNPYALDGDGDGFVQDGSAFQRPYIPVKKPGFDLPDVRGRKRSGDALLDKPRSAPKLPKDKNTWTRAQRNEALLAGVIEPETREDVAFLANRRPDNEGIAKYWDMSEADLTKEGNRLVNARRQATGAEKERIDEDLLKVSHEFQRRASYAETFGQEFVPPAKREKPNLDLVPVDITQNESIGQMLGAPKPKRTAAEGLASAGKVFDSLNTDDLTDGKGYREWDELSDNEKFEMFEEVQYDYLYDRFSDRGDDGLVDLMESGDYDDDILEHAEEVYNKIKAKREEEGDRAADAAMDRAREEDGFASRGEDEPDAEEIAQREADRALDEQADAALDRAIEGFIEKYGEDEPLPGDGFASRSPEEAEQDLRDFVTGVFGAEDPDFALGDDESKNDEAIDVFLENYGIWENNEDIYDAGEKLLDSESGLTDRQREFVESVRGEIENRWEGAYMRQQERDREEYYGGDRPTQLRTTESQRDIDAAIARYEEENMGFASGRREGEFGSNPDDSKAAKLFDSILEKYWKMWGFDVPNDDEKGWDEPFGFASRGNDEEVKQSKLDELVGGVKDRLIAELETADPATWKPSWRNDSLPINPTTGKPYKGWNAFFLMLAAHDRKYNTGRFAGFNQLKARGAIVRKGEKGTPILRPQLVKKEDEDGNVKEFVVFRGATVFNIDQTDGGDEALRAVPADLPESERIAILDETLKELGVTVQTANMTPHYSPDGDYISMPEFAKGTSALEWTSTLAHEAVHWTGHKSRMDRASLRDYSSDKAVRAYEELVAEIGSAMLLAAHGIEAPFRQDHAPYIKGWIQLLKDDPEALNKAFKDAQAAVNFMLEKSPNLRKLFGGIDTGKKAPEVDAPNKAEALVGASDGFASLHRVRTPGSSALGGILYDDNGRELMVGFLKGKSWDDLDEGTREEWIEKYLDRRRDVGGYKEPLDDTQIDERARDLYEDAREIGWYVYSDVSMEEVQELAAARSKGKHINALKKLKKARKASDEDQFNFFGRDERVQDVTKSDGFASVGTTMHPSYTRDSVAQWYLIARSEGSRGRQGGLKQYLVRVEKRPDGTYVVKKYYGKDENQPIEKLQSTVEGPFGSYQTAKQVGAAAARAKMPKYLLMYDNIPVRDDGDGFASRGAKKLGVEPRYQDRDWINRTQERILKSGLDFQSLPENDRIDWVNSFLNEYLSENEMGHGLSDVANGRRLNTRPDIDLLNYAEEAYARMSDAHMARRAQFGRDDDGFASVGRRTRRLGIKPSQAVDYISYDPESENLYVAYKREDGRGDMYVYEGVSMDDAIGVENAESVGKAINDIKRRKNVRKATPEEIVGLSEVDADEVKLADGRLVNRRITNVLDAVRDFVVEIQIDDVAWAAGFKDAWENGEFAIDEDGSLIVGEGSHETAFKVAFDPRRGGYVVSTMKWDSGDRETPGMFTESDVELLSSEASVVSSLARRIATREMTEDAERRVERELDEMKRELDMAGDAPGVESVDVTYSSALDAVDYNPSTQELRVSYKGGGTYVYEGVDRTTFEEFKSAPSKGRAMNDIKRAHPYRKDGEWTGGGDEDGGIEEFDVRGSAAVEKVTYDPSKEELTVVYAGGKGYIYSGVTREEADAVRSAPSKGRAINDVKRTHDVRKMPTEVKGGPDLAAAGWSKGDDGKWRKGIFSIVVLRDEEGNYKGLLATHERDGAKYEQEAHSGVSAKDHLDSFEEILRGVGNLDDDDETISIDPAPAPKPRVPTRKPPRGGKRVRNRNVVIEMEQGTLDEIIEAEGKNITVDALRDAAGSPMGKYTKGPRKGKNRGYDTITVRDAETGELLHANEILLTSSASPGRPSAANRKRGYIRARSYAGRQGHNVMKDEGPSLRGEGRGMTDYDKRVYGLGSDEKNREAGLASRRRSTPRLDEAGRELDSLTSFYESRYGEYFEEDGQMDLDELIQQEMRRQRIGKREATKFARDLQKDYLEYVNRRDAIEESVIDEFDAMMDDDGFASRSGDRGENGYFTDYPRGEEDSYEDYVAKVYEEADAALESLSPVEYRDLIGYLVEDGRLFGGPGDSSEDDYQAHREAYLDDFGLTEEQWENATPSSSGFASRGGSGRRETVVSRRVADEPVTFDEAMNQTQRLEANQWLDDNFMTDLDNMSEWLDGSEYDSEAFVTDLMADVGERIMSEFDVDDEQLRSLLYEIAGGPRNRPSPARPESIRAMDVLGRRAKEMFDESGLSPADLLEEYGTSNPQEYVERFLENNLPTKQFFDDPQAYFEDFSKRQISDGLYRYWSEFNGPDEDSPFDLKYDGENGEYIVVPREIPDDGDDEGFASQSLDPYASYRGGNGNDSYDHVLSREATRIANNADWVSELVATEYLPNTEPGSEESNIFRKIVNGEPISRDEYLKLPNDFKDEIDLYGNESGDYMDALIGAYEGDGDPGFASRGRRNMTEQEQDMYDDAMEMMGQDRILYEQDMAEMAAMEVEENFTRLSSADQNMYFQRALANNPDSGMTTEQILEEAKKLAMDDRRMAQLEREAIGMGQSSKPRKIDVSSSSALNSVEYDEMNRVLSVEYRGRDGKGTGTVYNYDGVEPEVVDRLEAADSRGATMREVRDNYEFRTTRKLPDSAYEGLPSRGSRGERDADFSEASPELRDQVDRLKEIRDRIANDMARGRSKGSVRREVMDDLLGGYIDGDGTLYFPSKESEGDYIAVRYNPDTDEYLIERIKSTRGFNRDEPADETVVQSATEESMFNAGSRVYEFAKDKVESEGFASGRRRPNLNNAGFTPLDDEYWKPIGRSRKVLVGQDTNNDLDWAITTEDDGSYMVEIVGPEGNEGLLGAAGGDSAEYFDTLDEAKQFVYDFDPNEYFSGGDGQPTDSDIFYEQEDWGFASRGGRRGGISSDKINNWYATRNELGGSDKLTREEESLLRAADNHFFGPMGKGRLTPAKVREFIDYASQSGTSNEKRAVAPFIGGGLASRGGNENIGITKDRNGHWVMSAMVTGNRGASEENRGTRRMQYTVVGGSRRDALKAFRDYMDENNVSFDGGDGFASRGSRRSTREMERELNSLKEPRSYVGRMKPDELQEYRKKLIDARNQAALEMIQAAGLDPKKIRYADDISADEDDFGILEEYDFAIDEADEMLGLFRKDKSVAEAAMNAAALAESEARDAAQKVRNGSTANRRDYDSDEEYIEALRDDWKSIFDAVEEFVGGSSEGASNDSMETYDLEHDTYVFSEERELLDGMQARIDSAKTEDDFEKIGTDLDNLMTGLVRSHEERYREDEATNDYETPFVPDEDELPTSSLMDFLKDDDAIAAAGESGWLTTRGYDKPDGFASRGRRRPGRRNQGRQRQGMAPKTRYTDEERQTLADRAILRSRKRPGKRFEGPRASEWDGFASTGVDEMPDMAVDSRGIFEGGEHGPGKDMSLRVMWNNIRRSGENNEWFDDSMTADDLAQQLGVSRSIAQGLLDARPQSGGSEKFIDDPYLADTISQGIGMTGTQLFGFDPLQYYDDSGVPALTEEAIDAAISSERARRAARVAAREGRRTGKATLYRNENGDVNVRALEEKLNVKLTDDNGNLLSPSALNRATQDTGLGWGLEKWRRIYSRGGALSPLDVEQLVSRGILDEGAMPSRDDLSFEEVFQWPGFADLGSSQIIDALSETLGLDRDEILKQRRSIQQALTSARRGERRSLATRNLQKAKLKLSRAKIAELTERLGLDASEFERWFSGE